MTMLAEVEDQVRAEAGKIGALKEMLARRLVGQTQVVNALTAALISKGHVLLEGLPGLAKTTAIKALSDATDLSMCRVQFTPDLLPSDILGTQVYDPRNTSFFVKKGPIFTNLLLADEINRSPAKVQSALLQAMQERMVTIGDETFKLEDPFLVLATQNPIEQEGTYPLPEAQIDRFLFKIKVHYGTMQEEEEIIRRMASDKEIPLQKVMNAADILRLQNLSLNIHVDEKIRRYIVSVVFATREPQKHGFADLKRMIQYGASPRASINLERAARVQALMKGRAFVTPQDVKDVGLDVLRHRIILSYEAEAEGMSSDDVVGRVFAGVDVP